ncbi:hypothetical protein JHD50_11215 [Sulfurimonas sp. MAG313]|nr:hypothetical protein [Sulfurimonas sp. MAG313]MDF1881860.1 hypothetical protein [Sulfurimonas sp. MAG313]
MTPRLDTQIISRYGWDFLIPSGILLLSLLLFIGLNFFTLILSIVYLLSLYMHRNPERISDYTQEASILSPVDGKIKEIISMQSSPIDGKPGFEIIIDSACLDIAVLRSPTDANMRIETLQRGASLKLTSNNVILNENANIRFIGKLGDILVHHTLGSWSRPLKFGVEGKTLQAQRYGFMLHGISSIYLPSNSRVAVKEGMNVQAGSSVIGFFSETV